MAERARERNNRPEPDGLSPTEAVDFRNANEALALVLAGNRAALSGRITHDRPGAGTLGTQMLTIVPPPHSEAAWRALDLDLISLEKVSPGHIAQLLADLSPEVSSGLNDFLRFCNPGVEITALTVGSKKPNPRAQAAVDDLLDQLRRLYGTVDVPINRLFMSAFLRGAFLAEGVFGGNGRGMVDIATPDPAAVRFRRAVDPIRGEIHQLGQWQGGKFVVFDRPTVKYIPVDPFPGVPYGRPMIAPAIFLGLFNLGLLRDIRRVVAQQGYPRLDVSIDLPKLFESLPPGLNTIEAYADWAKRQLEQVASEYAKMRPEDAYVHFSFATINRPIGTLDSSSLGAVDGLTKAIERGLARALKTSPIILGLTEGTSEAQANRQWEIHAARIKALQHPCEWLLGDLFTMHLNSLGIQANVEVRFGELRSAELLRDEQVRQLTLANADAAYKAGYITLEAAAKYGFDVDELPTEEDRYQAPAPPPVVDPNADVPPPNTENPEPGSNRAVRALWLQDGHTWRRVILTGPATRHNRPGDHPDWNGFHDHTQAEAYATKAQAGWRDGLEDEKLEGIQTFKGNNYTKMNALLRSGTTGNGGDDEEYSDHVHHAREALKEVKTTRNLVTYRGMASEHIAANFDQIKPGHQFSDKGFNSTSFNSGIARQFADGNNGGIVLKVHMPRGTHAAYTDHPKLDLSNWGESEMLLPPGTKYEVLRARYDSSGRKVIAVRIVSDGVGGPEAGKAGKKKQRAELAQLRAPAADDNAPEFVHEGADAPNARTARFGVKDTDLEGLDGIIETDDERRARANTREAFTPSRGTGKPAAGDPEVTEDDVDKAIDEWDTDLPDYAGLLDADLV